MSADDNDFPSRSSDGLAALDVFYKDFNDINFYVEDEDQENLYEAILRKLFPNTKISRIFPLGGKAAVIRHALSNSNQQIDGFRAYIMDKDFDDLLEKKLTHPQIFYLDRFCIENYLTEHQATLEIVVENHPKRKRSELSVQLGLDEKIESFYANLRPLFTLFFCAQRLNIPIKNCSLAPEKFCEPRRLWEVKPESVEQYCRELSTAGQAAMVEPPVVDPLADSRSLPAIDAPTHSLVSGKYVAALVFHYVKSKYGLGSMTFESFVYRLAKNSSLASLNGLAQRISQAVIEFDTAVPERQAIDA